MIIFFAMFAYRNGNKLKYNTPNKRMLNQPQWLIMALFCIVFSSASKRLIELRIDQRFNYAATATIGKKIKDGSRDKREFFKSLSQSTTQRADDSNPVFFFAVSAFIAVALLYFFNGNLSQRVFKQQHENLAVVTPIYLNVRRLQV